ncbi:MAG: hypothetical protein RL139_1242 [Gemmatimonadota bacterium]|jgi:hypothetical protein
MRAWRMPGRRGVLLGLLSLLLAPRGAAAHELAEASATLVLREGGHVELRLLVPWAEVLRQRLMPERPMRDFLARVTEEPPGRLERTIAAVEAELSRDTRLMPSGRPAMGFTRWRWPDAARIRAALREELMDRLAGGDPVHPSRLQAVAEAIRPGAAPVRAVFPRSLGPVLLTVVRPREEWVTPGRTSTPIPTAAARRIAPGPAGLNAPCAPARFPDSGRVAQLVEQVTVNHRVTGSSPVAVAG